MGLETGTKGTLKIIKMLSLSPIYLGGKLRVFGFGDECASF